VVAAFIGVAFGLALFAGPAAAQARACSNKQGCVLAVTVNGLIDPVVEDYIKESIEEVSPSDGYRAIVLVVDSPGSVISNEALAQLVAAISASEVPVTAWVGPSGAQALGGAAELVAALPGSSLSSGSVIGDVGTYRLAGSSERFARAGGQADSGLLKPEAAVKSGIVSRVSPTLGDHVLSLKDMPSEVTKDDEGRAKRKLVTDGVNQSLPMTSQLFHTAASPSVAYLMLAIAIGLLLFEFFTAGVGVAGFGGAIAAVLAGYGLGVLPVRPWALALCLLSAVAFAIDIQTAIPRLWTLIGSVMWIVGSVFLFNGIRPTWIALATGIGGMLIGMVSGMPSMVRARFGTPTLGRTWMIGETGTATSPIDPEGFVTISGGRWRALTNRATPIEANDDVRVVEIDGLTLVVEPLEGGAVDYRERRGASTNPARDG
jgi:membrane-bound serine protease (ClpP class)